MRLIDADAVRQKREDFAVTSNPEMNRFNRMFVDLFNREIGNAPTIDAVPVVHGWWTAVEEHSIISENVVNEWVNFYCSECDAPSSNPSNYCPNCGAKMDEVQDGTD